MFVSESTLNFVGGARLQVMSAKGLMWEGQIDPSTTVESFKKLLFQYFHPDETALGPDNFRVVYAKEARTLRDNHALHEETVKENDVLLFIQKRNSGTPESDKNLDLKAPTAAEIAAATKDIPVPLPSANFSVSGFARAVDESTESLDFQLELRKILISLISVMSTLLEGNDDAKLICQQFQSRTQKRLHATTSKPVEGTSFTFPPISVEASPMGIVAGLCELKKREFRVSKKAFETLKEMGYSDGQIIEALRMSKNSTDSAIDLLTVGKSETVDDGFSGLDRSSHLFIALSSAPMIRLGMSNPKTLLAFLNILESPTAANVWLSDLETAPVLSTIFKIYHAEKHAAPES